MDYKKVHHLLEKYFEGETSLQEEAMLSNYFNENEVAANLQQYQPLFQYFKEEQSIQLSNDFENRLFEKIESQPIPSEAKTRKLNWFYKVQQIAAVAVILLVSTMVYKTTFNQPEETVDIFAEYDALDEQEAYERTKAALMLISNKLNTSTQKAAKGFIEVRNATNKVKLK